MKILTLVSLTILVFAVNANRCVTQESGTCVNVDEDGACDVGAVVAGLCPGAANIKCCIPTKKFSETQCMRQFDECKLVSRGCSGSFASGKCPGSASVKCCEAKSSSNSTESNPQDLSNPNRVLLFGDSIMQSHYVGKRFEDFFRDTMGYAVKRVAKSGYRITALGNLDTVRNAFKSLKPTMVFIAAGTNIDYGKTPTEDLLEKIQNDLNPGVPLHVMWLGAFPECKPNTGYRGATENSRKANSKIKPAVEAGGHLFLDPFDSSIYGEMPHVSCGDGIHPSSSDGRNLVEKAEPLIRDWIKKNNLEVSADDKDEDGSEKKTDGDSDGVGLSDLFHAGKSFWG